MDKVDLQNSIQKRISLFIRENGAELVTVDDKFFKLCYNDPAKIDTILGKGTAEMYVPVIIARDAVLNKLFKDDKAIRGNPDWGKLLSE